MIKIQQTSPRHLFSLTLTVLFSLTAALGAAGQALGQQGAAGGNTVSVEKVVAENEASDQANLLIIENAILKIVEERKIPSRNSGIIKTNQIKEGSLVKMNQLVMQIDDSESQAELRKTQKELEMAKADAASRVDLEYSKRTIEVAQAELSRALRSNQRRPGVVAQSELDQLSLVVKKSVAEKQKTEFQVQMKTMNRDIQQIELELGRLKNDFHQILSPIDGMIVEVYHHQGEWVQSSDAVARVIRMDRLKTEIKLPAEQALNDLVGASATFYPSLTSDTQKDGTQSSYAGKVTFIYPEANPISSEVRVWVEIENDNMKLIPGLTGRVEIQVKESKAIEK